MSDVDDKSKADSSTLRPSDLCQDPDVASQVQLRSNNMTGNLLLLA